MAVNSQSKEDVVAAIMKFLHGKIDDKDEAELRRILFDPGELRETIDPELANDALTRHVHRAMDAAHEARQECGAYLDDGLAFDSAGSMYRHALRRMGMTTGVSTIPDSAARGIFRALRQAQNSGGRLASDSAPTPQAVVDDIKRRFPGAVIPRKSRLVA